MSIPDQIYAGDTLEFRVSVPDFPPADGWTLRYNLVPRFTTPTQAPVLITATVAGDDYLIAQAPGTTASWAPGAYGWARWVEKSGARQVLNDLESRGQLEVLPNPATALQGADNRTAARKALEQCDAALANMATRSANTGTDGTPVEYRIADRMMKYQTIDEARAGLLALRDHWQRQVNQENRRAVIAARGYDPYKMGVRF